jgi:hypothetical protein
MFERAGLELHRTQREIYQFSCDMLADFIFDWGADLGPPLRWKDNVLISRHTNSHLDLYAAAI